MKVLWIVSNFPTDNKNFAGLFYKRMVHGISELGITVIVVAPKPIKSFSGILNLVKGVIEKKKDLFTTIYKPLYFPIPFGWLLNLKVQLIEASVNRCLKEIHANFDLVHSCYAFPWGVIGMSIAKRLKIPLVLTCVGDDINMDIFKSRFIKNSVAEVLKFSRVISVSHEMKRIIEQHFLIKDEVLVIYDGLDFSSFPDRQLSIPENQIVIGFVGELTLRKGCDILIDIINQLGPQIHWRIVGDGVFSKEFRQFPNVTLLGNLPPKDVLQFYQSLTLFVFPSKSEGIPNVLKEAAFFSVPIVASRLPGIVELTDEGDLAHLVSDYNDGKAFVEAVRLSIVNIKSEKEKADNLKDFVSKNFCIRLSAQRLVDEYRLVLREYKN